MKKVELLILDVDGVLTDGRLLSTEDWAPAKAFCVQDGHAIKTWQRSGGRVALLSGRKDGSIARRASELGIETIRMGAGDKLAVYAEMLGGMGLEPGQAGYVGDDLPDIPPMRASGWSAAVANARAEVKRHADYVTGRAGGDGAVAEVIELLLRKQGKWSSAVKMGEDAS